MNPIRRLLPRSLFGRTAAGLLLAFLVFEAIAFAVVWHMVVRPLAERSADDLAAKIVLAAKTWVELPPETRADYEMELSFRHNLELGEVRERLPKPAPTGFFQDLLQTALSQRSGQSIQLKQGPDADWDWLEIQVADKLLRVGFDRERYVLAAPLAAVGIFILGAALTVLTALLMARQVSRRLGRLADLAHEVGQGRSPLRLPETGSRNWWNSLPPSTVWWGRSRPCWKTVPCCCPASPMTCAPPSPASGWPCPCWTMPIRIWWHAWSGTWRR